MKYTIPIKLFTTDDGGCHLLVKAMFGNKEKGWLILDSGANKTVFDIDLLENFAEIGEELKDEISSGINASIDHSKRAILKKFTLANLIIKDFETVLISLEHLNSIYSQMTKKIIYGLLGGDFFLKYNAIINYKSKILSLYE